MPEYVQLMSVKKLNIETGKLIAILNGIDAKELGVFPLDRVKITNPASGKSVHCVVDVTTAFVKEDEIGLFEEVAKALNVKDLSKVNVSASEKPKSVDYIKNKMDGKKLSEQELKEIVKDISSNMASEIEITAFVSAVYINGLDLDETVSMTKALIENGKRLDFGNTMVVDKHSIGGTNGRSTMVIVPIIAAAGLMIPKTSSRSITSAAGTADSMEVLAPVTLNLEKIMEVTKKTGGVMAWGGAVDLAPADDKIIKIEHPLSLDPEGQVIASVMAKKASVGAKFLIIDIPIGPYVKVKTREQGESMALKFIEVGKKIGIKTEVMLTNGNEPSGKAFGPGLEARYAMEVLEGKFFDNLAQKSCELAGALLELCGAEKKMQGYAKAREILESGKALQKMQEIIKAQGGSVKTSADVKLSDLKKTIFSKATGEISNVNVMQCINLAKIAGAPSDAKAGIMLLVAEGEKVKEGQPILDIYAENRRKLELAAEFAKNTEIVEMQKVVIDKFG
jgi:AMP phosphorylase